MILYHGGTDTIKKPLIIPLPAGRDFGMGFYCTEKSLNYMGFIESLKLE
jgi:hypothetical protein